jgi:FMN-dependent NADH-azoreductase
MTKLLYVEVSPNKSSSNSSVIAQEVLSIYGQSHTDDVIDHIDLWNIDLPEFDETMIAAKFSVLRSQTATDAQAAHWGKAVALSKRFNSADKYLFSIPIWNFGLPYRLKHFIDIATLPGQNWSWSRELGYSALLRDKRAILIYSSAGIYPQQTSSGIFNVDFQKHYMRQWLGFIGIDIVTNGEIDFAPTLSSPDQLTEHNAEAMRQAREIAPTL